MSDRWWTGAPPTGAGPAPPSGQPTAYHLWPWPAGPACRRGCLGSWSARRPAPQQVPASRPGHAARAGISPWPPADRDGSTTAAHLVIGAPNPLDANVFGAGIAGTSVPRTARMRTDQEGTSAMAIQTARKNASKNRFEIDVTKIRDDARKHMAAGAVTDGNTVDRDRLIEILNEVIATEVVCYLRYSQHAIVATGIDRAQVATEFTEHAAEEMQHGLWAAERVSQLGGEPDFNPGTLAKRSHTEYVTVDAADLTR